MAGLDWAAAKKYGASGSPLMLIGSGVSGLLTSMHLIGYRWGLIIILAVMVGGTCQHSLQRQR